MMLKRWIFVWLWLPLVAMGATLEPIGWGVVTVYTTPFYDKTGKELGQLSGGELFKVLREVKMNKAPAYYVTLERKGAPNAVLSAQDSRYFPGKIPTSEDVEALVAYVGNQKLCREYYSLCANRDRILARKREQHLAKSPAKMLPKLKAELAQVPALERKYEAAQKAAKSGTQRLKYQDLRKELRYRATGLQQEIKRLEEVAATWEKENPFDESEVKRLSVWKRLNAQAEKLRPQVEALTSAVVAPGAETTE